MTGAEALPIFGVNFPTEDYLHLLGDIRGKVVLEIGCGGGHLLKYFADRGAVELWGVDPSQSQLDMTEKLLSVNGYYAELRCLPTENLHSILESHFDLVCSLRAISRSSDLAGTFEMICKYLKPEGSLIFSCADNHDFRGVAASNERKISEYINALADAGFFIDRLIEPDGGESVDADGETDPETAKARVRPRSFIIKAKKPPEYYY